MDEKSWQITSSLVASSGGLACSEFPGSDLLRASLVLILCCQRLLQGTSPLTPLESAQGSVQYRVLRGSSQKFLEL